MKVKTVAYRVLFAADVQVFSRPLKIQKRPKVEETREERRSILSKFR